jgi:uncharacterized membrane protein
MMAPTLVCVVALAAMIALTRAPEVREGRKWRIAVSLPLVWVIAAQLFFGLGLVSGIAAILSLTLLGFIWSGTLAHFASDSLVTMLHGEANLSAGHSPDFRYARGKIEDGDLTEAIRLTLHELEKNPANFEGLYLLAQLYFETHRPDKALNQIENILQNPDTTPEQFRRATAAKVECLNELNHRGGQHR